MSQAEKPTENAVMAANKLSNTSAMFNNNVQIIRINYLVFN